MSGWTPPWRHWASRREPSGFARSTRLGREILRDAGVAVEPLVDRAEIIRELWPDVTAAEIGRLDTAFSRLKLDLAATAAAVAADPDAGPLARAFVAYERAITERGGLDFDDLVRRALDTLDDDPVLLARWRDRCAHLLVDEVQDVDRSQLRLALLLAAPADRIFLVGDDDQSIYGWRLADVRRVLALDAVLPGLRRVDLQVNHRCPVPVVERAVRLIEHNRERFAKVVRPRPDAPGSLILAPDATDEPARTERLLRSWPDDGGTRAILARTNRELRPAVLAALALGEPFRAPSVALLVDDPALDGLLARASVETDPHLPLLVRLGALRRFVGGHGTEAERDLATALLAWAPPYPRPPFPGRCDRGDARLAWRSCAVTTPVSASPPPTRRRVRSSTTSRSSAWRSAVSRADARSRTRTNPTAPWRRSAAWATSRGLALDAPSR